MSTLTAATVGHGSTALWYLTRSTGLVALILLSGTVVLGIVSSVGWTTERWPRFVSQSVHRNLSLFCLALIAIHVVTTVADGYVPIGYLDAVIPFRTPYRPLWVGLGALAFDLLLAVAITSGLRRRIGVQMWRGVHWLAYLCWPVALLHGLGAGTDTRLSLALFVDVLCVLAVVAAVAWRLVTGRIFSPRWRIAFGVVGGVTLAGIGTFAFAGPLRPGWSHRAGTSAALLAQLSTTTHSGTGTSPGGGSGPGSSGTPPNSASSSAPGASTGGVPTAPFSSTLSGSYRTSQPNSTGHVEVLLNMHLHGSLPAPLQVELFGTPVSGGVAMSTGRVTLGHDSGAVTTLSGSTIGATVRGKGGSLDLVLQLNLDQTSNSVTGSVSGTTGGVGGTQGVRGGSGAGTQ